jgi:hypothetical protein
MLILILTIEMSPIQKGHRILCVGCGSTEHVNLADISKIMKEGRDFTLTGVMPKTAGNYHKLMNKQWRINNAER